jgi:hypothetical protein
MSNPKEAAKQLLELAKESGVRFPTIWDESKLMQTCGATIVGSPLILLFSCLSFYL